MLAHVSRRKQALSAAASAGDRGGISRVLLIPDCGALVITASAHKFDSCLGARGSRIEYEPFNFVIGCSRFKRISSHHAGGHFVITGSAVGRRPAFFLNLQCAIAVSRPHGKFVFACPLRLPIIVPQSPRQTRSWRIHFRLSPIISIVETDLNSRDAAITAEGHAL